MKKADLESLIRKSFIPCQNARLCANCCVVAEDFSFDCDCEYDCNMFLAKQALIGVVGNIYPFSPNCKKFPMKLD